jgi:hypothetical protein
MDTWSLRDEVLAAAQRWPLIVAFILLGSLLGWGLDRVWPAPYRATNVIVVGLNPYRVFDDRYVPAFGKTVFRNVDDYKYWQMQQLEALAYSDAYLQETLARLRQQDISWQGVDSSALRGMLQASWRNAGRWSLTAENMDRRLAVQAVNAWSDVFLEQVHAAIAQSQALFLLDLQMQAITRAQLDDRLREDEIVQVKADLLAWQAAHSDGDITAEVGITERWQLQSLASRAAGMSPDWQVLLQEVPPAGSAAPAYLDWIDHLVTAIAAEIAALPGREQALSQELSQLDAQWQTKLSAGSGLAATLTVDRSTETQPLVDRARTSGQAALVGGGLGLLAYLAGAAVRITRKRQP